MNIIIPMAGAGQRFVQAGYQVHKPAVATIDRRSGKKYPMAVCAAMDLPGVEPDGANITFIERTFHKTDGVENEIRKFYRKASFIAVDGLTEGQACTCLLAGGKINTDEPLLIAGCDSGMVFSEKKFESLTAYADAAVFTFRHHDAVLKNPDAYGWMLTDEDGRITGVSVKKAVSDTPLEDHAAAAVFWFRHGYDFVKAAEKMIAQNDRINNEFYVDQAVKHALELGVRAYVFELERYIGWGTPKDYEEYMKTLRYWKEFVDSEGFLPERKS